MRTLYSLWGSPPPSDLEHRYREALREDPLSPGRAAWLALRGYIQAMGGKLSIGEDDLQYLVKVAKKWSP